MYDCLTLCPIKNVNKLKIRHTYYLHSARHRCNNASQTVIKI